MFIKKVTKRNKDTGAMYLTYRLVRSYRIDGKPRHQTILDLGTLSGLDSSRHKQLADRIDELLHSQPTLFNQDSCEAVEQHAQYYYKEILKKEPKQQQVAAATSENQDTQPDAPSGLKVDIQPVDLNSFDTLESKHIGGEWLCYQAYEQIGIHDLFLNKLKLSHREYQSAISCLTGRLLYPGSDLRTASCLNENSGLEYLFENAGRWSQAERRRLTKISEKLYQEKELIITTLNNNVEHLLDFKPKIILFDLTNTHFEGRMSKSQKAAHGRNKQKRNEV